MRLHVAALGLAGIEALAQILMVRSSKPVFSCDEVSCAVSVAMCVKSLCGARATAAGNTRSNSAASIRRSPAVSCGGLDLVANKPLDLTAGLLYTLMQSLSVDPSNTLFQIVERAMNATRAEVIRP